MSDEFLNRWEVIVEGHRFDLDRIEKLLTRDGYLLRQNSEGNTWYFSGPAIEEAADATDARRRAVDILDNATAVLRIGGADIKPVTVGSIIRHDGNENVVVHVQTCDTIELRAGFAAIVTGSGTVNGTGPIIPPPPPFERERRWFAASQTDEEVQVVLDLLESDRDNKYYRAFERIRHDLGGDDAVRHLTGWSKANFSKFTATLNAPRHEKPNREPCMSLSEAEALATEMIRLWLNSKS